MGIAAAMAQRRPCTGSLAKPARKRDTESDQV
jgi:hypothetical protein